MPRLSFKKSNSGTIRPIAGEKEEIHTFPKGISPKVYEIVRLEFEQG